VVGRKEVNPLVLEKAAPQAADALGGTQEGLGGHPANRKDCPGLQQGKLTLQKGSTGGNFILFRVPVIRGSAFNHIGDKAIGISIQIDGRQHLIEEVSRPADKGPAGAVFIWETPSPGTA